MEDSDLHQIYDQQYLTKGSLFTYVTLILYIPLGLALLCLRLLFCLCSILVTSLSPPLKTSVHFITMYANFMGIYINNYPQNPNNGHLIVSNHRSAFDLLVVKSIIPKCKYINEVPFNSLVRLLLTPILCDKQQQTFTNRPVDFFKNKQNYPLVVFAEQTPTNGRCLLTFDSAVFESVTNELIQPVAISLLRPWIPICLNGSSLTVNTLASLFSPFTVYDIAFLEPQTNSERTRQTIATKLGASLSQFGHEDIRKVLAKISNTNTARRPNNQYQQAAANTMSFSDISKLALQIKDILPHASYDLIQRHIHAAPTLDIDTVLASILDDDGQQATSAAGTEEAPIKSSISSPVLGDHSTKQPIHSSKSALFVGVSSQNQAKKSFRSYEERKFELLNDARRRFLLKNAI